MSKLLISLVLLAGPSCIYAQDVAEILIDEGYDKYLNEDYQGAILDFDKALAYDDTNPEVYFLRGVSRSLLGDKKAGMADLNKAIELNPNYAEAYYERGYIFLTDQNAKKAIEEFDRVITLTPDFAEAYVSRGTARCMLGDPEGANEDWQTAKALGVTYGEFMACE